MQLNEFPTAIESAAQAIARHDEKISRLRFAMNGCELEADLNIAFDAELKNDHQRKARRATLLNSDRRYGEAQIELAERLTQKAFAQARLEALRNEFEITKDAKPEEPAVLAEKKFYLTLALDPTSEKEWSRIRLYDPLTHCSPELSELLAEMVQVEGEYLIELALSVKALQALNVAQAD